MFHTCTTNNKNMEKILMKFIIITIDNLTNTV
jgi:hypothetical protein